MAMQAESPVASPSAQVVGNAFVEQYYHILHQSPELVYRFYQDSSVLSRPDSNGVMTSVTTMQGINEKILSLNYKDYIAEIKTADAQQSYESGVIVLVTGYLTGKDNVRKKFAQSFFLAPQEKGFFVLNDVVRYVDEDESRAPGSDPVNGINEHVEAAPPAPEPDQPSLDTADNGQVPESAYEDDLTNEPEVCDPSDHEDGSITEEEIVEPLSQINQSEVPVTSESSASQDDAPKKSYASILKVMKANASPTPVKASAANVKVKPPSSNQEIATKAAPVSAPSPSTSEIHPEKSDVVEEVEGYSIYVRNLPQSTIPAQLDDIFSKYGPIKKDGVQVRSNKQGFCFGFVKFESLSSMKSAIEASPITIGGRKAVIEEKRTTTQVSTGAPANNGRGRYPSSRGNFRSESFRGRGNFSGGGRGYGRNEFRNQGEYSNKPRGGAGRGSEGYQRVDQNGTGNTGRQGGQK